MNRAPTPRDAAPADLVAIQAIYAHHVRTGLGSFELEPPSLGEMERRFDAIVGAGHPFLVATEAGAVVGYAYASAYRARPAYRATVEDSVYVAPDAAGRGIGRALLGALVERTATAGFRQMVAIIGDSGNLASVRLHRRAGFRLTGTLHAVGYKFGRWVDTVIMQRALGPGADTPPD